MSNYFTGRGAREIGFDEGKTELEIENARKKEKLIHVILHGEDVSSDEMHIGEYPPNNPAEGQMWYRTSDAAILLWYVTNDPQQTRKGQWVKTYDK